MEDDKAVLRSSIAAMNSQNLGYYKVDLIDGFLYKEKHFFIFERDACRLKQIIGGRKHLSLQFCIYTIKAVARAIKEIHENNIQHRDICSTNLFIDDDRSIRFVTCPTGLMSTRKSSFGGDAGRAPEGCCDGPTQTDEYNMRANVWSLGILAYELA